MAKAKRSATKSAKSTNAAKKTGASKRRSQPQAAGLTLEEVKRLAKAPADYEETARTFADALVRGVQGDALGRLVLASMPDQPALEAPFQFMVEYMSVDRTPKTP